MRVLRDVLEQVKRVGVDGVSATLQHALNAEERRVRSSKRVAPDIAIAFAHEREREHQEFLHRRLRVQAEFAKDKGRRQTISELIRRQQALHD